MMGIQQKKRYRTPMHTKIGRDASPSTERPRCVGSVVPRVLVAAAMVTLLSSTAWAQTSAGAPASEGWRINVYPILVWVPVGIAIDVELPPVEGGGGSSDRASIVDGRFDGAYLGGVSATNGKWRIQGDAIWAAVGGDRVERPFLKVDADIIYGYGTVGYALAKNFFVTGGVRRLALKYEVKLGDRPTFERKPGIWDPLIGIAFQRIGKVVEVHANFDGGGFGAGADVDLGGTLRVDLKPTRHFGITAGYSVLYLKLTDTAANRDFTVEQTLHGPVAGIGLYF